MARRREAQKRKIIPDPKFNDPMVARFINCILRKGEKGKAESILYTALDAVAEKSKEEPLRVFRKAVENAAPMLEVRSRRVGGATYQVPMEVPSDRQNALAMRWIVRFANSRKGVPMAEALANEIMDAYQGQGASIRRRDEVHKMAQSNKAFAHFRW